MARHRANDSNHPPIGRGAFMVRELKNPSHQTVLLIISPPWHCSTHLPKVAIQSPGYPGTHHAFPLVSLEYWNLIVFSHCWQLQKATRQGSSEMNFLAYGNFWMKGRENVNFSTIQIKSQRRITQPPEDVDLRPTLPDTLQSPLTTLVSMFI